MDGTREVHRRAADYGMIAAGALGTAALACSGHGTRLQAIDARAELNQQRAAAAILQHVDGGPVASLAEAVYCSARGTLLRADEPSMDAGVPCPR